MWGQDRASLLACEARRAAAVIAADAIPLPQKRPSQ